MEMSSSSGESSKRRSSRSLSAKRSKSVSLSFPIPSPNDGDFYANEDYHTASTKTKKSSSTDSAALESARAFYAHNLKQRLFLRWRESCALLSPQPVRSGAAVLALFKWISLTLPRPSPSLPHTHSHTDTYTHAFTHNTELAPYLFPYHALRDENGVIATYSVSRVREHATERVRVSLSRLPLFLHALGLLDAFQLCRIFLAWREIAQRAYAIDSFAHTRARRRTLSQWYRATQRSLSLRRVFVVLSHHTRTQRLRVCLAIWQRERRVRYCRERARERVFFSLRRSLALLAQQRECVRHAALHSARRVALYALWQWLSRLCKLAHVHDMLTHTHTHAHAAKDTDSHRENFLRWLTAVARLALSTHTDNDSLSHTQRERARVRDTNTAQQWIAVLRTVQQRRWSRHSQCFLSHTAALYRDISRPMRALRHWRAWASGRVNKRERLTHAVMESFSAQKERRSPTHSLSHSPRHSPDYVHTYTEAHSPHYGLSYTDTQRDRNIDVYADVDRDMQTSAHAFVGLHTPTHRAPTYDTSHRTSHDAPHRTPIRMSSPFSVLTYTTPTHLGTRTLTQTRSLSPASTHHALSSLRQALSFWHAHTRRRLLLRRCARIVHSRTCLRYMSAACGAWLILTARRQSLRRAEHRVTRSVWQRTQWMAWFVWRDLYERAVLIRGNRKAVIAMRNAEMREFQSLYTQTHSQRHSQTYTQEERDAERDKDTQRERAHRRWAMYVLERRKGERLAAVFYSLTCRRALSRALSRWRENAALACVATHIKRLWRGYKTRFVTHYPLHVYLQWYRNIAPLLVSFVRRSRQRKVMLVLKAHHDMMLRSSRQRAQRNRVKWMLRRWRRETFSHKHIHSRSQRRAESAFFHWRAHVALTRWQTVCVRRVRARSVMNGIREKALRAVWNALRGVRTQARCLSRATQLTHTKRLRLAWQRISAFIVRTRVIRNANAIARKRLCLRALWRWRVWRETVCERRERQRGKMTACVRMTLRACVRVWKERAHLRALSRSRAIAHRHTYTLRACVHRWRDFRSNWSFLCRHTTTHAQPRTQQTTHKSSLTPRKGKRAHQHAPALTHTHRLLTEKEKRHYFGLTHLRRTLRQFHEFTRQFALFRARVRGRMCERERRRLQRGVRAFFVNWRQRVWRESVIVCGGDTGRGRERLRDRARERRRARLPLPLGTQPQAPHEDEDMRTLSHKARKARALLRERMRHRVQRTLALTQRDPQGLLVSLSLYLDRWLAQIRAHFRDRRALQRKRYLFLSFLLTRALGRWAAWARIYGKRRRQWVRARTHHIRRTQRYVLTKVLLTRARRLRRGDYIVYVKAPICRERAKLRVLIRRWLAFAVKARRRQRAKEGFVYGTRGVRDSERGLRVITKLRRRMSHFLHQLLLLVQYRKERERTQLPYRLRPYNVLMQRERDFMRLRLQRLHARTHRRRVRRSLFLMLSLSFCERKTRAALRHWWRRLKLTRALRRIRRRIRLLPALAHWAILLADTLRTRTICTIMDKSMSKRIKRNVLQAWRAVTIREGRLRASFDIISLRALWWEKRRVLYAWSVTLDAHWLRERAEFVRQRVNASLRRRAFSLWQRQSLLSEMITWQNSKTCWTVWKHRILSLMHQRETLRRAERFADSLAATLSLRKLRYNARKEAFFCKLYRRAMRWHKKRVFARWLRRLRRRVSQRAVDSLAHTLAPTQPLTHTHRHAHRHAHKQPYTHSHALDMTSLPHTQRHRLRLCMRSCAALAVSRSLRHWARLTDSEKRRRALTTKRRCFVVWARRAHGTSWRRLRFSLSLSRWAERVRLSITFARLKRDWQCVRSERALRERLLVTRRERLFFTWCRLTHKTKRAKRAVERVISAVYRAQLVRVLRHWRVCVGPAERLRELAVSRVVLSRWRKLFIADKYARLIRLCVVWREWKRWMKEGVRERKTFVHRRRALMKIALRRTRFDRSLCLAAFHKWRLADYSVKFSVFWRNLVSVEKDRDLALKRGDEDALATLVSLRDKETHNSRLTFLVNSQAGALLLFGEGLSEKERALSAEELAEAQERASEREKVLPRSLVVQSALLSRCLAEEEKRQDVWRRTEAIQRGRARSRERHRERQLSIEEKLASDSVSIRDKMTLATSPQRPQREFIGLSQVVPLSTYEEDSRASGWDGNESIAVESERIYLQELM